MRKVTEDLARLFESMGYVVEGRTDWVIEISKMDYSDFTRHELDVIYDEAGMYDSVRVGTIIGMPQIAQIETGV